MVLYEQSHRLALALRCLVFFLLGAPLGCIIKKGGFGMAVLLGSFFMLLEYVLSILGREWALVGKLSPHLGASLAELVIFPCSILALVYAQQSATWSPRTLWRLLRIKWRALFVRY